MVVWIVIGVDREGTPAKVTAGVVLFVLEVVGPAPKLSRLSTRYPQVLAPSVIGEAGLPPEAGTVLFAGETRAVPVSELLSVRV